MNRKKTRSRSKTDRRSLLTGLAFISPWIVGFLCFTLYPIINSLRYSFTNYSALKAPRFVGLDNYKTCLLYTSGILTGKYREGARFAEGDNRRGFWSEERFEAVRPDMEIVEACTAETGLSMGHLALAYNMTYPGISCVIPGAKNAAQALDNAAATGLRLSSEIMER